MSVNSAFIEKEYALVTYPRDGVTAKKVCVELIKKWAHMAGGSVPYVWGGCSIIETCKDDDFFCSHKSDNTASWECPTRTSPHTGCDCSGLIFLAAQSAGLNFFCKNTTTMGLNLTDCVRPSQTTEERALQPSDLILLPRHVVMLSDVEKPAVAQAVGYSSGYGITHEAPLSHVFNVTTCEELVRHCKNKLPLIMKNKNGGVLKVFDSFRLLSLV